MSYIGEHRTRIEDFRLLTGTGEFSDDLNRPGQAYLYVLRAQDAHAYIRAVDTSAAANAPGVLAVLTATDYLTDGLEPIVQYGNPNDVELKNRNGAPIFQKPLYGFFEALFKICFCFKSQQAFCPLRVKAPSWLSIRFV